MTLRLCQSKQSIIKAAAAAAVYTLLIQLDQFPVNGIDLIVLSFTKEQLSIILRYSLFSFFF